MEENHYYPFGLTISSAAAGGVPNKYKFGGKELEQSFGLELYDFHARQYDPQLGRFTSMDPLADYTPGWTPYRFGFNNPVLYTDPTGLFETEAAASEYAIKNNLSNYTIKHQIIDDKYVYSVENENAFFEMVNGEFLTGAIVRAKINASPSEEEQQQNGGNGWDATNTTLGAWGLASGIKETMIESGAALNRGTKIYNVNTTSLIRTYGVSGAKYLKYSKALGVAGSVVSTGYSGYKVYEQYNNGGANEVFKHRDVWDAGVGAVGLGATGLAAFGIISNPVGWGIGIGVLIYGGATLIYDAENND